jgi:membrane protease YdiL (CAAX protease family)
VRDISTSLREAPLWRGEWRNYLQFLRRPALPTARVACGSEAARRVAALLALDAVAMILFGIAVMLVLALGGEMPRHKLHGVDFTARLILLMVVIGPLMEETLFRGWLSGTARALGIFGTAGAVALIAIVARQLTGPLSGSTLAILVVGLLIGLAGVIKQLPDRDTPPWFRTAFPWLYWASCLAFAVIHLSNFATADSGFAVLWVAPQLISGTVFGYARVRYGMWANCTLHMAHNLAAVLIAASLPSGF